MAEIVEVTKEGLDTWATDPGGPVALHLRQQLLPVEVGGKVVFPPTYADIGYSVDVLADGTKVATIDSVGSQANRMEPLFKAALDGEPKNSLADLVPQIEIVLRREGKGEKGRKEKVALLDLAHRSADAVVRSCPGLAEKLTEAFEALRRTGDATPLCVLAPTSLVFGVWDSRGASGQKRPRLIRAVIRAWDVDVLHSAAQFNSVWKRLDESQQKELAAEAKAAKVKLSEQGFADAPSTTRDDGSRVLGGILVRGRIEREVSVNLVALRGLRGGDNGSKAVPLRKYLLGLSLLAATAETDMFLREGCHLRFADEDAWSEVPRRGAPRLVRLTGARRLIEDYTAAAAEPFKAGWPKVLEYEFDLKQAKEVVKEAAKRKAVEGPKD